MSWENTFLTWFAKQSIPMSEKVSTLGSLSYHQFSSTYDEAPGQKGFAFGCSPDRKIAAIKCAAETIERQVMYEFFHSSKPEVSASSAQGFPGTVELGESAQTALPPKGMKTSNGWAVQSDANRAVTSACLEAMERHLLIKSYYKWGWQGFRLVQESQSEDMQVYFMTSRLTKAGYIAGIVAAKSPLYPGASFGYCIGKIDQVGSSSFWQSALFEAISKIISLGGRAIEVRDEPNAWLSAGIKHYLENPLDAELFRQGAGTETQEDGDKKGFVKVFDLSKERRLSFPLFAAFCWGGNLIPLCDPTILNEAAREYFRAALWENDLPTGISERHPII